MYNAKKRMRRTILLYLAIVFMGLLTLLSFSITAKAAEETAPTVKTEKYTAVMILWYTESGMPHNIFIVDGAHVNMIAHNTIVIDRTPDEEDMVKDQVLMGGMFDLQTFGYSQVFDFKGSGKWELKEKYINFALEFRRMAGERLKFRKDDRSQ